MQLNSIFLVADEKSSMILYHTSKKKMKSLQFGIAVYINGY